MLNTLESKARFTIHRRKTGAPVVADTATLADISLRGAMSCRDWLVVDGFVKLSGGTSPTITLIPLLVAKYAEADRTAVEEYFVAGVPMGPYADGDSFSVEVGRGSLFMRISAVTGSPTSVKVMLGGAGKDHQTLGSR